MTAHTKLLSWYFTKNALPYWCIMILDIGILVAAGLLSTYICTGGESLASHLWHHLRTWLCILPLFLIGMRCFHTYSGVLRYSTVIDLIKVAYSLVLGFILVIILRLVVPQGMIIASLPFKVLFLMFLFALGGQWGLRVMIKWLYDATFGDRRKRVFIYGVMQGGISLAKAIMQGDSRFALAGFISPDGNYESKYLMGVKVYTDGPDVVKQMIAANVKTVIVSPIQSEAFRNNTALVDSLIDNKIKIMVLPNAEEWQPGNAIGANLIQEVDIEELLPRDKIQVDLKAIGEMLTGKSILITGAAGSIGSEMARQVAKFNPKTLVLVDQAETPMHDVRLWMNKFKAKQDEAIRTDIHTIVGSISNPTHMEQIFSQFRPEYVFHAAAYKHVPMMEDNPAMAVQNNIYGTRVIADLAVKYGTKKFVMISTDKAVNPTNVMGCSKRICEIYCQSLNAHLHSSSATEASTSGKTQFITTRFGNVLGSNGSVIPIFREQIRKGGPLTVTHPDIIRFFMLIPEACQLVLEAGTMGHGGEIFIFDMGKPVRIADLAKRMIDLSGAKNIEIKYTGLRDGEKLYEEVLNDAEQTKPTVHPKIKVAAVREYPYEQALANEEELHRLSFTYDDMAIVKKMKEIVPEYKSQHSKYEALD